MKLSTRIAVLFSIVCLSCGNEGNDKGNESGTPVFFGDPFVMLYDGVYYAYGTGAENGIEVYVSDDLSTWTKQTRLALDKKDSWADGKFWAPEVYKIGDKFYMYYSADEHICVATSDSPAGPFAQEIKQPMIADEKCIDNTLFVDDDGTPYMYFDRFNDGLNVWVAELESDLQTVKPETMTKCINVSQKWEEVWPRVNEGSFVVKHGDLYYMIYSANSYESQFYGIGYATAKSPTGPWTKYDGNPVFQKPNDLVGVGHGSIFKDKQGKPRLAFHAHYDTNNIHPRIMYIAEVSFTDEATPVMRIGGNIVRCETKSDARNEIKLNNVVALKSPGNRAIAHELTDEAGILRASENLPLDIKQKKITKGNITEIVTTITAKETVCYSFETRFPTGLQHDDCQFYMPGFWYHRNMHSPAEAPSFKTSDSWQVREDRLSVPLTGIFDEKTGDYCTVVRRDGFENECLTAHNSGEVILSGKSSTGFTGFRNLSGTSALVFGFPYREAPKTYIRKLTLAPPVQAFEKLEKGESRVLTWEIRRGNTLDYSSFVAEVWNYSYDTFKPQALTETMSADEAKKALSNFFVESYVDVHPLKYFSGVHMRTDDCKSTGSVEVGFVGRVLLNAFNALEYGEQTNDADLIEKARSVFDSYLIHGFTPAGFFREFVNYDDNGETSVYSIRRQSEGAFAVLNYLKYERDENRRHPEWEAKIKTLLDNFASLQNNDGSFPRKFDDKLKIIDPSGGSTPSATLPLTMAYAYFKNEEYLRRAESTAEYLERELISKSDYFSSTLDANCEDKEASLYASTAMYYLATATKGEKRRSYVDLCKKAAYFALSWYYVWDVPFARGQMLGDVGFKSRGWGNVSVENNHIDVFIFEFGAVLDWLAVECNESRFADFCGVIRSSMFQLMPVEGRMFDIGKAGYYPEVVQHTNWDYGKNGKGFYNDIFAPGWTVASLWQLLSPDRVNDYFEIK